MIPSGPWSSEGFTCATSVNGRFAPFASDAIVQEIEAVRADRRRAAGEAGRAGERLEQQARMQVRGEGGVRRRVRSGVRDRAGVGDVVPGHDRVGRVGGRDAEVRVGSHLGRVFGLDVVRVVRIGDGAAGG